MALRRDDLITCRCQTCGSSLRIRRALAGKRISCPKCKSQLQVESSPLLVAANHQLSPTKAPKAPPPVAPPPLLEPTSPLTVGSCPAGSLAWGAITSLSLLLLAFPHFGWHVGRAQVWAWALMGFLAGFVGAWKLCRPVGRPDLIRAVGASFFTGIIGIAVLLVFQLVAQFAARFPNNDYSTLAVALRTIGTGTTLIELHQAGALNQPLGVIATSIVATISIGFLEEFVKLIPVMAAVLWGNRRPRRNLLFLGAASGLGFGTVEGITFSFAGYVPNDLPSSIYVVRFLGLASLHAAWTILGAILLLKMHQALALARDGKPERLVWLALVAPVAAALPHGIYDAFAFCGLPALALPVALLSVAAAAFGTISVRREPRACP
jgi:RsiW-degrading membrane proteinase PrsW (M82 family)